MSQAIDRSATAQMDGAQPAPLLERDGTHLFEAMRQGDVPEARALARSLSDRERIRGINEFLSQASRTDVSQRIDAVADVWVFGPQTSSCAIAMVPVRAETLASLLQWTSDQIAAVVTSTLTYNGIVGEAYRQASVINPSYERRLVEILTENGHPDPHGAARRYRKSMLRTLPRVVAITALFDDDGFRSFEDRALYVGAFLAGLKFIAGHVQNEFKMHWKDYAKQVLQAVKASLKAPHWADLRQRLVPQWGDEDVLPN